MRRDDQTVRRGVDRRRRSPLAVQADVEGGDHLVLPLDTGVDVGQRPQPVEAQHRKPVPGERAEIPPDPFTHNSSTGRPVTGSTSSPLADVLPPA